MTPQLSRRIISVLTGRRRRKVNVARLRLGPLEDRITPVLFDVLNPTINGLNNNGAVAVADLNKDGHMDAVLTNFGTGYGLPLDLGTPGTKIVVLYGNGSGGLSGGLLDTNAMNASFVTIADINGDTWPDVLVSNANQQNAGSISVFRNINGNLSLAPGSPFSSGGNNSSWVGVADTTGDGIPDLVVGSFGKVEGTGDDADVTGNNISIFQGNGDYTFSSNPTTLRPELQFVPTALAVADFDGDNVQDIAAIVPGVPPDFNEPYPNGSIYVFEGNGSGGFGTPNQYDTGGVLPVNIQAADLNGDGKKDLIVANAGDPNASPEFKGNSVGVVLNVSSPDSLSFSLLTNSLTANTYGTFAVAVADFDMDTNVDIAAVNYGSQADTTDAFVAMYMGNGNGGFATGSPGLYDTNTGVGGGQYLAVGDFDESGTPDLIVAHASNKIGLLLNTIELAPSVTINQGSTQSDPTNASSIVFDVVFSEGVNGFASDDVDLSGSSMGGLTATVTPVSSSVYTVSITGMSTAGTVMATIPAAAATSINNATPTTASTSTDNVVTFDNVTPTVTINQATGQADPATTGPILYSVVFSENVTGFGNSDIDLSESSIGGLSATVTQNTPSTYTVSVSGMTGNGTVIAKVLASAASDGAGNPSAASTSSDNTVTFGNAPSVTINQGSSQIDPTNSTSIVFDVVFTEGVTGFSDADVDLSGSSVGGLLAQVSQISATNYTVTVTGLSGSGTVKATIPAGAATSIAGSIPTLASTSNDNQVSFDLVSPTVTINKANGQADPTESGPILFTVVFSEDVVGFGSNDVDLSESSLGGLNATVTQNTASNYTVSVTGMNGSGIVTAKVLAGAATDAGGNPSAASTSTDNTVAFGAAPTVTINQGSGQVDPTNSTSIVFDVVFAEGVTGFTNADVDLSASSVGSLSAQVSQISSTNYTVTVTGMSGTGTVIATIPAGAATSSASTIPTLASTSNDNEVSFDLVPPTVTIDQASGQADPASTGPILFTVVFSEDVSGFGGNDVDLSESSLGGLSATVTQNTPSNYTVSVTGMNGNGTVVAKVPAGAATDSAGNASAASTSTDNLVVYGDITPPSVTIDQAVGQVDPTNVSSINFDVKFSEPVLGFDPADVNTSSSTVGGSLSVTITGSLDTYTVTVTGMTTSGFVIATIPAGGVTDAAGNANLVSTSTDNSVEFLNTGTLGFTKAVYDIAEDVEGSDLNDPILVTITVTRSGQTDGPVSIKYATSDGTAHSGGPKNRGQDDYKPTNGTLTWNTGEGGDREFTVQILRDTHNEGKELINLELTDAGGSPVLGITEATVAITPSDGSGPGVSLDQDNDRVAIKLNGKTGTLLYYRSDPDGDSRGPIELIELTDTLPDPLRPKASLVISVAKFKSKTSPGDGVVDLGAITGSGLRSISARKANLNMEGIDLDGYLGSLVIGNIVNEADIATLGTTNPLQKTRINALSIGDGTTIDVDNAIANLTAIRVGAGEIIADSIGKMVVRGQARPAIVGDMVSDITLSGDRVPVGKLAMGALIVKGSIPTGADIVAPSVGRIVVRNDLGSDITISGNGVDPTKKALGLLRVVGAVTDSDIKVGGNVGAAVVGAFRNSQLFAGYDDDGRDPPEPAGFNLAATVTTFRSLGKVDGFQNSRVIATKFSSVTINNLVSSNLDDSGNPVYFGFYADTSLGKITVIGPERFVYDPTLPPGIDEFEVVVV